MPIQFKVTVDRVQVTRLPGGTEQTLAFMTGVSPTGERLGFSILLTDPDEIAVAQPGMWFKLGLVPDTEPPTAPTPLAGHFDPASGVVLAWAASTDDVAVAGYQVFMDNGAAPLAEVPSTSLNWSRAGLPSGDHTFSVAAVDYWRNVSAHSNTVTVTVPVP